MIIGGNAAPIQYEIDQMIGLFNDRVKPGDAISPAYDPAVGTQVIVNGDELDVIEVYRSNKRFSVFGSRINQRRHR